MKKEIRKITVDIIVDIVAGILLAAGTYNFAAAANFPLVGFTGIALIMHKLFALPIGWVIIALNIPVAALCYKVLGRRYFLNSVKSIIITSLLIDYVAPHMPIYEGDKMLAAICTGVLSGIGYALIYMRDSSTGGTDFIILSVKAIKPHLTLGKLTFLFDTCIVVLGTFIVSKSINGLIYGIIITFIISTVVDKLMYGLSAGKMTMIVTDKANEIAFRINEEISRGSTFIKAKGSYSEDDKDVVMCACSNKQMYKVVEIIKKIDENAFMVIMESNEVVGRGFGRQI